MKKASEKEAYNHRQIELMTCKINEYKKKLISLDRLVSSLCSLLDCLQDVKDDWANNFIAYWADLESVNANALDLSKSELDTSDYEIINRAISGIEELIAAYIKENFNEEDIAD